MTDTIIVLDFGSQYSQLIARRIREAQVYAVLLPWDTPQEQIMLYHPKGFILSGGPLSVYDTDAPYIQDFIIDSGLPILGICYGLQALTQAIGGKVAPALKREFGSAGLLDIKPSLLLNEKDERSVWMSHGDHIEQAPPGFKVFARTANSPIAAIGDEGRGYYGLQFHPEVRHTPSGSKILQRFVRNVCKCRGDWTPNSIIDQAVDRIQRQVGNEKVLSAVSGGVDSSVATALVQKAIGAQLTAIYVDTGLMRHNESQWVDKGFRKNLGVNLVMIDASQTFFSNLSGVTEPELKRSIIGETFIRIFESKSHELGDPPFLVQGTIYPDVIESRAAERKQAQRIKTHHNVGGLPEQVNFELVEPLRFLFKDEVRTIGEHLGLPTELVWRQPFPGPGLAVRCLGFVTPERVSKLQKADAIFTEVLNNAGLLLQRNRDNDVEGTAQSFAVLLPVKAVGVMGDHRTYEEVIALRAITTDDFMTADWARLPYELLAEAANRIVNEVKGINRVVYDITSKPPATIEWE
jgi:GMP synthase (glutamine-hydrolysing)